MSVIVSTVGVEVLGSVVPPEEVRISTFGVEVLAKIGESTEPDPDGQIDITSDSSLTFGTKRDGSAVFDDSRVSPEWWQTGDSLTGNEERQEAALHFAAVPLPDDATIVSAWLGLTTFWRPYYNESLDAPNYPGTIYGESAADPAALADTADGLSRLTDLTSASIEIPYQSGYVAPSTNWIDVTDIVQEIRSSGGHVDGNDMQFFYRCLREVRAGTGGGVWPISVGFAGSDMTGLSPDLAPPRLIIDYSVEVPDLYDESGSGGVTVGGSALVVRTLNDAGSGGAIVGASAVPTVIRSASADATIDLTAEADAETYFARSADASISVTAEADAETYFLRSASSSIHVAASAAALVDRLTSGTANIVISTSAAPKLGWHRSGSSSIVVTASASPIAAYVARGTSSIDFTASATSFVDRLASGSSTIEVAAVATPGVIKPIEGAATIGLTASANATRRLPIAGTSSISVLATGDALQDYMASGTSSAGLTASAVVVRDRYASGSSSIVVGASAAAIRSVPINGSSTIDFATSATPHVIKPVAGTSTISVAAAAAPTRTVPTSGTSSISFVATADVLQDFVTSGASSIRFDAQAGGLQDYLGFGSSTIGVDAAGHYWQHVGEGLLEYLLSQESVTELVGDRIYPIFWTVGEGSSAIVYTFSSTRHGSILRRTEGVAETDLTLSIFARTIAERDAVAAALHAAVVDYSGLWGAVTIRQVLSDGEGDGADIEGHYFRQLDYLVTFDESAPFLATEDFTGDANVEDSLIELLSDFAPTYANWIEREEIAGTVIRYRRTNVERGVVLHDGETGHDRIYLEVAVRSIRINEVYRVAEQIRCRLDGLVGKIEDTGALYCKLVSDQDGADMLGDGSETPYYEVAQSWVVAVKS